jgi:methionine-gamma-lyase
MASGKTTGIDTLCIHGGHIADGQRAHLTPIYASSTYTFESVEQGVNIFSGKEEGYIYGRFGNPTINETERKIALLEAYGLKDTSGKDLELKAILHASGMAAITTMLLSNLKAGDKIISHPSLYGGTQEMIDKILPDLGIGSVIADFQDMEAVRAMISKDPAIRMMYLETPANPTLQCVDMEALSRIGKEAGLVVCADNTFATPLLQQPFRYEVDFVIHSTTKFLNGHGTAVGGILIGRDLQRMNSDVQKFHRLLGGNSNAFEAFLLTNGLRTLNLRMERHCDNAEAVAAYLQAHPAVAQVNYPGLENHPHHAIATKQMKRYGAVMSIELKGGFDACVSFVNKLKVCTNAVSLGTCDTLVSHPASTTHCGVSKELRLQSGITDGLIRMSIGIETVADLIADLEQALEF